MAPQTQLIRAGDVRKMLGGIGRKAFDKWLDAMDFPQPIVLCRIRYWILSDVQAWIGKLTRRERGK